MILLDLKRGHGRYVVAECAVEHGEVGVGGIGLVHRSLQRGVAGENRGGLGGKFVELVARFARGYFVIGPGEARLPA